MIDLSKSESAVSEVIGNIMIFAIVLASVAIVLLAGGPLVESGQNLAKMDYITSTFLFLQSDVNRVAFNQIPFQNIVLKLGGGSLILDSDSNISNITLQINGNNFSCNDYIEYTYKGTHMAYINGGVYKLYNSQSAQMSTQMISAPRIFVRENMTYVSLYHLTGHVSRAGIGNVLLTIHYNSTLVDTFPSSNLTIELQGSYADVQGRYLEDQGFNRTTGNNYTLATDHVTVTQYFLTVND
jgi:hypothetical protein